jgi:hypothetical protein
MFPSNSIGAAILDGAAPRGSAPSAFACALKGGSTYPPLCILLAVRISFTRRNIEMRRGLEKSQHSGVLG